MKDFFSNRVWTSGRVETVFRHGPGKEVVVQFASCYRGDAREIPFDSLRALRAGFPSA